MGRDSFSFGATVTVAFDEDWLRVMQEAIKQSGSHGGITDEDSGPVLEGDVGRDDDRAVLVAFGDDLKEQLCAPLVQGQISQFVQNVELNIFGLMLSAQKCAAEDVRSAPGAYGSVPHSTFLTRIFRVAPARRLGWDRDATFPTVVHH